MPLVLNSGDVVTTNGLHRILQTVFQIDGDLLALIPKREDCTDDAVATALLFLTREWLGDVLTTFRGKCALLAATATIVERALLPERPAFIVCAGKASSGKTTAVSMVCAAATGSPASATPWALQEDERRKAMFSVLLTGIPVVSWDNIPLGTCISSPAIERALTSAELSDRVLGASETRTVSAKVVQFFTGNNVAPEGDMTSRSLVVRLDVDRADPENRQVKHADPGGWTLANRGQIVAALLTILLGNPKLGGSMDGTGTRFRTWQFLVGAAIEHAAEMLAKRDDPDWVLSLGDGPYDGVSFAAMFADAAANDDAGMAAGGLLQGLWELFEDRWFTVGDVAKAANDTLTPGGSFGAVEGNGASDDTPGLRGLFDPFNRYRGKSLPSQTIGRELKRSIGTPMLVGGTRTLKLEGSLSRCTNTLAYRVRNMPGA